MSTNSVRGFGWSFSFITPLTQPICVVASSFVTMSRGKSSALDRLPEHVFESACDNTDAFFFDLECTDLRNNSRPPAIVEIAIVDGRDGSKFTTLVDPSGVRSEPKALEAHGIGEAELRSAPRLDAAWRQAMAFIDQRAGGRTPVLIGYNNFAYDCPVLTVDLLRYGMRIPSHYLFSDLYVPLMSSGGRPGARPSKPLLFLDERVGGWPHRPQAVDNLRVAVRPTVRAAHAPRPC